MRHQAGHEVSAIACCGVQGYWTLRRSPACIDISKASEMLGITRPTLHDLLNKYGLSAEGYSKKAAGQ